MRSRASLGFALALALALAFAAREAAAEEAESRGVDLSYRAEGVTGCFSDASFREAVRQRLAFDPFAPSPETLPATVTTRIVRDGARLRATIVMKEPGGRSEVAQEIFAEGNECATLSVAAALAVAMTIERSIAHRRGAESPAPAEPVPSAPPAPALPPPPPERRAPALPPAHARSRAVHVRTQAGAIVGVGVLPGATVGATAGASVELGRWAAGLEAGAWLPSEVSSARGGGASAWLAFLSGTACAHHARLFACGVATVGTFRAAGTDLLVSRSSSATYVAVGGRGGIELPIASPFSLVLQVGVIAPLVRRTLRIVEEELWRAPILGMELGALWRVAIW